MNFEGKTSAGRCRSCGAPIFWAVTDNGRKMPLDKGRHSDGRIAIAGRSPNGTPVVVVLTIAQRERLLAAEGVEVMLWRSHFQTCPQAGAWRR